MKTQEEVQAERREATADEIRTVYEQVRRVVYNFYTTRAIQNITPHIAHEDLVQECMIGWLEGQDIYRVLLDKYRELMPYSRYYHRVSRRKPEPVRLTPFVDADIMPSDPLPEPQIIRQMDIADFLKRLDDVDDSRIKTILELKYYYGMSLREMEEILDLKKSHIATLHNKGLEILKGDEDDY